MHHHSISRTRTSSPIATPPLLIFSPSHSSSIHIHVFLHLPSIRNSSRVFVISSSLTASLVLTNSSHHRLPLQIQSIPKGALPSSSCILLPRNNRNRAYPFLPSISISSRPYHHTCVLYGSPGSRQSRLSSAQVVRRPRLWPMPNAPHLICFTLDCK